MKQVDKQTLYVATNIVEPYNTFSKLVNEQENIIKGIRKGVNTYVKIKKPKLNDFSSVFKSIDNGFNQIRNLLSVKYKPLLKKSVTQKKIFNEETSEIIININKSLDKILKKITEVKTTLAIALNQTEREGEKEDYTEIIIRFREISKSIEILKKHKLAKWNKGFNSLSRWFSSLFLKKQPAT